MSKNGKSFKIIRFEAENIKKLKAVEILPDGNTVVITGKNEQGKTSILDAIWYALGGSSAMKGVKKPIREGEKKAHVTLDLGELIVKRTWTGNDKSYLVVENADGAVFKSPQAILDALIGNLSFDPLAFSLMNDKEQKETLIEMVELPIDLNMLEADRKVKYDERALINKQVKILQGQIAGSASVPATTPDEEIPASMILKEQAEAQNLINANNIKRRELKDSEQEIIGVASHITNIDMGIKDLKEKLADLEQNRKQELHTLEKLQELSNILHAKVEALADPDLSQFATRLEEVEEINKNVRIKKSELALTDKLLEEQSQSEDISLSIESLDKQKEEALKACKFPIEGLAFNEEGVTYKGIPFGQCSAAERLRVSLAMAMAMNPKLKVLRVMDGSLLDSEHMKIIQDMCNELDYQVWIEQVQEGPGVGIYISDGSIEVAV